MPKSRVCPEQGIQQSCTKKTNLLVYERERPAGGECRAAPRTYVPPITNPNVKRIRICTGAELKKMCPAPPCPCPPKKAKVSFMTRVGRALGFAVKSGVALSVVYITYDMGIWGDSETSANLYRNVCNAVIPGIAAPPREKKLSAACKAELDMFSATKRDPYCCDKFPIDHESSVYELQQKWNRIVITTFSTIAGFPRRVMNWIQGEPKSTEDEECCPCK